MFRELTCLMGELMAVAALSGCSQRPGRVAPTDIDPEEVAQALIAEHDKDGNGTLSAEELRTVAAIQTCQDDYDRNGDSQISPVELTENFQRIFDGKVGLITASCRPSFGQPVGFGLGSLSQTCFTTSAGSIFFLSSSSASGP